jgi:D-glycero-D-manno-heptose 1,7-bisphosphate phosphatase
LKVLFLDRDGVINKRLIDDYVKKISEFVFLPGVLDALEIFNKCFDKIFVVTNQQGIGKKIMTKKDLEDIHLYMLNEVTKCNGRIDDIFFCEHLKDSNCFCRKPFNGMYLQATKTHPEIIDSDSRVMIGDTVSDMQFAKNIDAVRVMITDNQELYKKYYDFSFESLVDCARNVNLFCK